MTLILKQGNMFDSDADALAHGVNTEGLMGAGIAVEFKRRWPMMYMLYKKLCNQHFLDPGRVWMWREEHGPYIYNIASQDAPGPNAKLEWFESGLVRIIKHAEENHVKKIAMPRIGCGIGGLKWEDVLDIVEHYAAKTTVDIEVWSL